MLELNTTETLGFTLKGVPVWPLMGSEPDDDGSDADGTDEDNSDGGDDDSDADADSGGDGDSDDAKKNENDSKIAAARKQAAKYRTKLKPWNAIEQEFGTPEQIRAKLSGTATNEEVETVRKEANAQVAAMRNRLASATVRALATDFTDPDDAVRFLDLSSIEVDEDGSVDEDEIEAELSAILERKPHLRKTQQQNTKRRPAPDKSQGSGKGGKPSAGTIESGAERYNRLMGKK